MVVEEGVVVCRRRRVAARSDAESSQCCANQPEVSVHDGASERIRNAWFGSAARSIGEQCSAGRRDGTLDEHGFFRVRNRHDRVSFVADQKYRGLHNGTRAASPGYSALPRFGGCVRDKSYGASCTCLSCTCASYAAGPRYGIWSTMIRQYGSFSPAIQH